MNAHQGTSCTLLFHLIHIPPSPCCISFVGMLAVPINHQAQYDMPLTWYTHCIQPTYSVRTSLPQAFCPNTPCAITLLLSLFSHHFRIPYSHHVSFRECHPNPTCLRATACIPSYPEQQDNTTTCNSTPEAAVKTSTGTPVSCSLLCSKTASHLLFTPQP